MYWGKKLFGLLTAAALAGCATTPSPIPTAASALPDTHRLTATPAGFISFCIRFPEQCTAKPDSNAVLALSDKTWSVLNKINLAVNNAIWPEEDEKHYGRAEYWTIPTDGYGDCDDYAVTKRKNLLDAGLPAPALRLAVVYSLRTQRHAVLTVATDKGDFVLDNLSNTIVPWSATDYTWIERQAPANPMQWVSLQPVFVDQQNTVLATATTLPPETGTMDAKPTGSTTNNGP